MDATAELNAIESIYKVMGSMTRDEQRRIMFWLESRFEYDLLKRVHPESVASEAGVKS